MRAAHQVFEKVFRGLGQAEHAAAANREGGNLGAVKVDDATIVLCRVAEHRQTGRGVAATFGVCLFSTVFSSKQHLRGGRANNYRFTAMTLPQYSTQYRDMRE